MQALILNEAGQTPILGDFKDPVAEINQQVIKVLAAGVNPVDLHQAEAAEPVLPRVVGIEGVGMLQDGMRVYFERSASEFGSIAQQSVITSDKIIPLPDGISDGQAIALGIAGMAGWIPLSWRAKLQPGETVLVLGATGIQGQIAVQAAKLLGAGKVIAAGRNREMLELLRSRGADEIAVLEGDLAEALKRAAPEKGYDVVIDSLFGEPFSGLLNSGTLDAQSRVVTLGGTAGQEITLGFRQLQNTHGATFAGYSDFFVPTDIKREAYLTMARHMIDGNITVEIEEFKLEQAVEAWEKQSSGPHHKLVIVP